MEVYWKTLNDNGVTKERMRSYDRPIVSEPKLRTDQKDGLIRDLTAYLRTLKVCLWSWYPHEFFHRGFVSVLRSNQSLLSHRVVKDQGSTRSYHIRERHLHLTLCTCNLFQLLMSIEWWQAVHSGADLESAIQTCMGYTSKVSQHIQAFRAQRFAMMQEILLGMSFSMLQGSGFMAGL